VVELQIIPIDEADGGMRTERWNGEHFQKVATDLESQPKLALGFGFSILSVNLSASSALSFNVQHDFVFVVFTARGLGVGELSCGSLFRRGRQS